ncbi:hypothetical protein M8494_15915 [Serratia ureilytica]
MFITLLVLLCFNLLGEGFEVAAPRVYDTLLGCAIAWRRSALSGRTGNSANCRRWWIKP